MAPAQYSRRFLHMDADLRRALEDENRKVEAMYDRILAKQAEMREREHPMLNDGLCRIVSINENVFAPALAEVWTDPQREKLVVFDRTILHTLQVAERTGRLVRARLRRTNGSRCIWNAALLPPADWTEPYLCAWCGMPATFIEHGHMCGTCHHLMPRSL